MKTFKRSHALRLASLILLVLVFSCKKSDNLNSVEKVRETMRSTLTGCPDDSVRYAGVSVGYDATNNCLSLANIGDLDTVVALLNIEYENYNDIYDNNYPGYSAEQLDSIDDVTKFDELLPYRNFEAKFPCFNSRRSLLEEMENSWLASDFLTQDPDEIDFLVDDGENTVFNDNYEILIGGVLYQMREDGLYDVVNGTLARGVSGKPMGDCFTNRHTKDKFTTANNDKQFKLKVAINCILVRSGAKSKVVSFTRKNNKWKRSRADLAVYCGGRIYNINCSESFLFSERKPVSGYLKRKQLKLPRHEAGTVWKTKTGELVGSFDYSNVFSRSLAIN